MPALDPSAEGDIAALYLEHHGWLQGWLGRRLGSRADAADLAQDTFVRVLGKASELAALREPRAWLTTIAHGLAVDHLRRQSLERAFAEALAAWPAAEVPSPETRLLMLDTLLQVDRALDGLKPPVRAAFLMSRLEGLTYPEIAGHLGVCLSSVEKYMATAIRHCLRLRAP